MASAISRYKVLKDDFGYTIGSNLLLTPEQAQPDMELGRLQHIEYLDPNDDLDSKKIRHFFENPEGKDRREEDLPSIEDAVKGVTGESFKPRGDGKPSPSEIAGDRPIEGDQEAAPSSTSDEDQSSGDRDGEEDLDGKTVEELREYAEQRGIDLTGLTLKDDIRAAIDEAEEVD